mmetsp:Transcript_26852/g.80307  ORF Transcript_26852/g.80307 Transcript_26852/m.80307 type:complete len:451 (+) Transcript_26852:850-2202(+)
MRPVRRLAVHLARPSARVLLGRRARADTQRHKDCGGGVGRPEPDLAAAAAPVPAVAPSQRAGLLGRRVRKEFLEGDRTRRRGGVPVHYGGVLLAAPVRAPARLRDPGEGGAVDCDGALPRAPLRVAWRARDGVAIGRAEGARGDAARHVEARPLVVGAVGGEQVGQGERRVRRDGEGVRPALLEPAPRVGAVVRGWERHRRREAAEAVPHPTAGVVLVSVLAEREGGGEVELPSPVPQAVLQRDAVHVRRAEEAVRVVEVHLADDKVVGRHHHLPLGHPLRRPDGAPRRRVREDVEDEDLVRVSDDQHLARAAIRPEEAVLDGEVAHQLDRLPRRADALRGEVAQLLNGEEGGAVWRPDRIGTEDRRGGALAEAQLAVVLDGVAVEVVAVRRLNLWDLSDRLCERLPWKRQKGLAKGVSDEFWVLVDGRVDVSHRASFVPRGRYIREPRI